MSQKNRCFRPLCSEPHQVPLNHTRFLGYSKVTFWWSWRHFPLKVTSSDVVSYLVVVALAQSKHELTDNIDDSRMPPEVVAVLLYDVVTIPKHDGEDTHPEYDKTSGEFVLLLLA